MKLTREAVRVLGVLVCALLAGCGNRGASDVDTFTLYRNSPIDSNMRIHVASFDSADGGKYNAENCEGARVLFQQQPGVTAHYWCEKGRYKG